jgi:hypothetical protein
LNISCKKTAQHANKETALVSTVPRRVDRGPVDTRFKETSKAFSLDPTTRPFQTPFIYYLPLLLQHLHLPLFLLLHNLILLYIFSAFLLPLVLTMLLFYFLTVILFSSPSFFLVLFLFVILL